MMTKVATRFTKGKVGKIVGKLASKSTSILAITGIGLSIGSIFVMKSRVKKEEDILNKYLEKRRKKLFEGLKRRDPEITEEDVEYTKDDMTKMDKIKVHMLTYGPAYIMNICGAACNIGALMQAAKSAAAAVVSPLASTAIGCGNEVVADKAKKSIDEKLHGPDAEKYRPKVAPGTGIEYGNGGHVIFHNTLDGRWFFNDMDNVRNGLMEASLALCDENSDMSKVMLNDLYDSWGVSRADLGDHIGWPHGVNLNDNIDIEVRDFEDGSTYQAIIFRTGAEPEKLI